MVIREKIVVTKYVVGPTDFMISWRQTDQNHSFGWRAEHDEIRFPVSSLSSERKRERERERESGGVHAHTPGCTTVYPILAG